MKKTFVFLLLILMLAVPNFAMASSYYLTLDATVGAISDGGGLASSANIGVGAKIQYVIEVDTDRTGYTVGSNGHTHTKYNSYYTSLAAGALSGISEKGYNYLNPYYSGFYSQTGNTQSVLSINNWTGDLASLAVGSTIDQLCEHSYNTENWGYTKLTLNDVTVTNISNVAPTPIPAAAFLMVGGLGVVGFIRRRFRR